MKQQWAFRNMFLLNQSVTQEMKTSNDTNTFLLNQSLTQDVAAKNTTNRSSNKHPDEIKKELDACKRNVANNEKCDNKKYSSHMSIFLCYKM